MITVTGNMWEYSAWKVLTASNDGEIDQHLCPELDRRHPWIRDAYYEAWRRTSGLEIWQADNGQPIRVLVIVVRETSDGPIDVDMATKRFSLLKDANRFAVALPTDKEDKSTLLGVLSLMGDHIIAVETKRARSNTHGTDQNRSGAVWFTPATLTDGSSRHRDS